MLDPAIRIIDSKTVTGFDPKTLLPVRVVQWSYTVGTHGPFTETTPMEQFTEEYIERETGKVLATLRATGAVPQV